MSNYTYYIYKGLRECTWALLLVILASCTDRRDLWVMADEYRQLELVTDWSEADDYPGGMTAWFIDNDGSGYTRNFKTAEVEHTWLVCLEVIIWAWCSIILQRNIVTMNLSTWIILIWRC